MEADGVPSDSRDGSQGQDLTAHATDGGTHLKSPFGTSAPMSSMEHLLIMGLLYDCGRRLHHGVRRRARHRPWF